MKIIFAASEAAPFIKTGGLGEVVGALSDALSRAGHEVRLILPKYRDMDLSRHRAVRLDTTVSVPIGWGGKHTVGVWEIPLSRRRKVWLVDSPDHFDRPGIYHEHGGRDFFDNDLRFIVLSRSALEIPRSLGFRPDIVHTHDWQTGLVPVFLKLDSGADSFFSSTASVFSLHNIAYQGVFAKDTLGPARIPWTEFTADKLEFYDRVNFLKAGLAYAHVIATVSPSYAQETLREEFGVGLEGVLRRRASDYFGVLNGIDTGFWNPAKDPLLSHFFSARSPGGRRKCRQTLQTDTGLAADETAPILGMVSRLDPQKGFDILLDILDDFLRDGCQAVFLGQGNPGYQAALQTFQRKYPGRFNVTAEFNETRAHRIFAGSDIFLMPSRFEPCGLGQMIALRYGSVPVVTPTGGLKDTVTPVTEDGSAGVGFVSDRVNTEAYRAALNKAVTTFRQRPELWNTLVQRGMTVSFDWSASVKRYLDLYRLAHSKRRVERAFR